MTKTKQKLGFERISSMEASRHRITVGRRVKADDGSLWVIVRMDRVDDADAYDTYMVRWNPLMKPVLSGPRSRFP